MSKYESFWCSGFQWMSLWRSDNFLLTLSVYLYKKSENLFYSVQTCESHGNICFRVKGFHFLLSLINNFSMNNWHTCENTMCKPWNDFHKQTRWFSSAYFGLTTLWSHSQTYVLGIMCVSKAARKSINECLLIGVIRHVSFPHMGLVWSHTAVFNPLNTKCHNLIAFTTNFITCGTWGAILHSLLIRTWCCFFFFL